MKKRKDDAPCQYCGKIMNHRIDEKWTHYMVCDQAKKHMIEGIDYLLCPECGVWKSELTYHLFIMHGINKKKRDELYPNLKVRCLKYKEKIKKTNLKKYGSISPLGNKDIRDKAKQTFNNKYGVDNPFASKEIQEKIKKVNQEKYGVDYPMQNEDVFCKQQKSANQSPNLLEQFFDNHTCNNVVFTGYGGRYIRTKTGVNKYGRLIKDLCPDFMVFPDNVLQSAVSRSNSKKSLDRKKHRSRYVIELLGDYYHSEEVIGVSVKKHEKEIIDAYASANIKCLVLWENDIKSRWNNIREEIEEWISQAVEDINKRPIYKKMTKKKLDNRKAYFKCPFGSGMTFKTQDKLDKWIISNKNLYRPELIEEIDFVVCNICSKRYKKLGSHIRRDHGISVDEYKSKFPESKLLTLKEKKRIIKENKGKGM